jgi:putative transposase
MARAPRIDVPGLPVHAVLRGHNRDDCFLDDTDRGVFLAYLADAARHWDCAVHSYVLMTNHVHLLVTAHAKGALSGLMHSTARRYSRFFNRRRARSGSLYESRFRSSPVASDRYFLACMRYIELNPVRAGMVALPAHYQWSSFRANASGAPSGLVLPHETYLALGSNGESRAAAYRSLFDEPVSTGEVARIRRDVRPKPRGRPSPKQPENNLVIF